LQERLEKERRAQLRLAAEALVHWIHQRRLAWSDEALEAEEETHAVHGILAVHEPLAVHEVLADHEPLAADELGEFSEFSEEADAVADTRPWSAPPRPAVPPVFTPSPPVHTPPPPVFAPPPPPVFTPPPVVREAPPVFAAPPPPEPVAFDSTAIFDAEPPVVEAKKPAVRRRVPKPALGSVVAPLIQAVRRAAPIAVALIVVVVVGLMARPYVGTVKTWVSELSKEPTPSKPDAVVAKPAPPRPAAGAARTGQLIARSDPPGAKVLVDGTERGVTPLTLDDVTIGPHTVVVQSDKGSVRRTVTVASDRAAVVSESIFAGWLNVYAPFELQITEGPRVIRLDETGRVLLPPGPHDLRLENRDLGYQETRRVEVQPGETTSLSIVVSPSTLTVTASAPAVVSIDGQQVGETPLTNHPIALGTRDILVKSADGMERRFTRKVTVAPVQIDVDFSRP
jgi:hypothetical protein